MTTDLFRIVYCSRNAAVAPQDNGVADVEKILATSRANNARHGVTGALMYSAGFFAQTLEGNLEAVQRIFETIQRDPRHCDVVVLQASRIGERLFGKWDMALAETQEPAKASAILGQALANPNGSAGADVVALLDRLISGGAQWGHAAE
jgi:hypothetical protein